MKGLSRFLILFLPFFNILLLLWILLHNNLVAVFQPAGIIAREERNLIIFAALFGLAIVIPVILLIYFVVWKYDIRKKNSYTPDWTGNNAIKLLLWAIPSVAMLILAIITWSAAHRLDPYKAISSQTQPLTIQVVALDWKWLFIYPQQHIATVNTIIFPVNTPINFQLTADAPMNSFWIPQLGGQMYAMPGMENQLHLIANHTGDFGGTEVEINGSGFANMRFTAHVLTVDEFTHWVQAIQSSSKPLDQTTYTALAKPSENTPVTYYAPIDESLYNQIMMKYMQPSPTGSVTQNNDANMMNGMR